MLFSIFHKTLGHKRLWIGLISLFIILGFPVASQAEINFKKGSWLRDSEIESTLKALVEPILKVAHIDPESVKIVLIAAPEINAAATVGPMILINTGLILKCDKVEEIVGVLAHEIGHIAGGHIVRTEGAIDKMKVPALAALALGVITGIAAGDAGAGAAVGLGGVEATQRSFLHYSRGQEGSADQAGLKYLEALGWSAEGLQDFMKTLQDQELLSSDRQDPYLRTHPLTEDRIAIIARHVEASPLKGRRFPASLQERFIRMKAKIQAFMDAPAKVLMTEAGSSAASMYAQAIAYYRKGDVANGERIIEKLLAKSPKDPFYWELRSQMLFENGKIQEAIRGYKHAVTYAPNEPLIRIGWAQALMEEDVNNTQKTREALAELDKCEEKEKENAAFWHLKAIGYGRLNEMGLAALALAEKAMIEEDNENAENQANRAINYLKTKNNQRALMRAKDLLREAKEEKKE